MSKHLLSKRRLAYVNEWRDTFWKPHNKDKMDKYRKDWLKKHQTQLIPTGHSPVSMASALEPPMLVESDAVMIASDIHTPFHDDEWLNQFFCKAKDLGIGDCLIIGDFMDCDSLSIFPTLLGQKWNLVDELDITRDVIHKFLDFFKRVFICQGNHEYRWAKLHTALDTDMLWSLVFSKKIDKEFIFAPFPSNLRVTKNDHIILNNDWMLVHAKNFRQAAGSVAQALSLKYQMNIGQAHGHYCWGPELDNHSKSRWLMDLGGLFNPFLMEYMLRTSTTPRVNRGFAWIVDGKPFMEKEMVKATFELSGGVRLRQK